MHLFLRHILALEYRRSVDSASKATQLQQSEMAALSAQIKVGVILMNSNLKGGTGVAGSCSGCVVM